MIVKVDGIENSLEFPDGTDQTVIQNTVKKLLSEKKQDESGFLKKYLPSVQRIGEIYSEEVRSGQQAMSKATKEPTGRSILQGFLGALQYGFSPLTALTKGAIKEPITQGLERAGVPEGVSEFAGDMAETAAYFVPYGKAVQTAVTGQKAIKEAETLKRMASAIPKTKAPPTTAKPLKFPEGIPEEVVIDATKPISEANQKILRTDAIDDVIAVLKEPVSKSWNPGEKRITQEIVDYMMSSPDEIEKIAVAYKLTPAQLTAQIKETLTLAGRDLGRMGQLAKVIKRKFNTPYMKQLSKYFDDNIPETTAMDKFGDTFRSVENIRRAALVSQVATTMRNIISQGGRLTIGSIDDAFQGATSTFLKSGGEGVINSVKSTLRGLGEGLDLWAATVNRMSKAERATLTELLKTENAISAKAAMFRTPVQDVVLTSKVAKALNILNTTQEYFFRNIAFEAKLRQFARKGGIDLKNLQGADIPEAMFNEAAQYALRMTFAAAPKSRFGRQWVNAMTNPVMTALSNPFPRFLWGNALPFLKDFSPIGFLEAVSPKTVAAIVSGHPEKFTKAISEATIGTLMLNTAFHVRNSKYAGEKWYEVKIGDKRYDTRAFAPFSTYLFVAESLQNPEKVKASDFGTALLSLNRIGGTGLVLSDIMRGRDIETTIEPLKRLAGAYMSGFTVTARSVKDIYSAIDPEEAVYRDIRDNEFFGPSIQNIPKVSQQLPKARTPLKPGDIKSESPLLRQFTGLSYRTKNDLQKEVDNIQLNYKRIYPGTGNAEGDRKVSEIMASILEIVYPKLVIGTNYKQLDVMTRRIVLGQLFTDVKKEARNAMMKDNPNLAMKIKIDDISNDMKELLKAKGVLPE